MYTAPSVADLRLALVRGIDAAAVERSGAEAVLAVKDSILTGMETWEDGKNLNYRNVLMRRDAMGFVNLLNLETV